MYWKHSWKQECYFRKGFTPFWTTTSLSIASCANVFPINDDKNTFAPQWGDSLFEETDEILFSIAVSRDYFSKFSLSQKSQLVFQWNLWKSIEIQMRFNKKFGLILRPKPKAAMSWNAMPILPKALGICVLRSCTVYTLFHIWSLLLNLALINLCLL